MKATLISVTKKQKLLSFIKELDYKVKTKQLTATKARDMIYTYATALKNNKLGA